MTDRTVLEARGVRKVFPGVIALDGVDFNVYGGEVHALLGANGAGKSTLIKVLAGVYVPDAGEIRVDGVGMGAAHPRDARRHGISVIYQDFSLIPSLSIAENLFLGNEVLGRGGRIAWGRTYAAASAALERIGANFDVRARVSTLGTGERQLVEIAKALHVRAKFLVLDEPTAALSHGETKRLLGIIEELRRNNVGVIYVTHRLEEVEGLVDRVTVLRDGRSAGTYPASEVDRDRIVSLMVGEVRNMDRALNSKPPAGRPSVLEVDNLGRDGEFQGLNLALRPGEIAVLTGLVGSGRTELLETIFGVRQPDAGALKLRGTVMRFGTPREAIAAGVVLIPEDRRGQGVIQLMSIYKNMTLASLVDFERLGFIRPRREKRHARDMSLRLDIKASSVDTVAQTLSGGNQQKVALAKWLSTDASVFLFDEPTQGLDVRAKAEIHKIVHGLAEKGAAVLVVSSDLEEVVGVAHRVLVMRAGRLVAEFSSGPFDAEAIMQAITLGKAA